ncbi:MAG TPA: mercury(II) reductase [Thermoprotei archaeon]|nr:mercury(II) reductase [Thermoprotei archaeon]
MKRYDYIVVGGGAAGFSNIVKLNELSDGKATILLVSKGPLGGTCVNTGCVPSKTLIEVARHIHNINRFRDRGLEIDGYQYSFAETLRKIREVVEELRVGKYENILKEFDNVEYIFGEARFIDRNTLEINHGDKFEVVGDKILISTGSRPAIPPIDGLDKIEYLTTDNLWSLDKKPDSIAIIGSGAVGLEISQSLTRLGIEVYLIEVLDRPIPNTEPEISEMIKDRLEEEGVKTYFKTRVEKIWKQNDRAILSLIGHEGKREIEVDKILLATGRKPNTEGLNLEKAGVEVDDRGFIKVNSYMQTTNPDIYSAGDVAASPKPAMLETIAAREGVVAAFKMTGHTPKPIDYNAIPVVVFIDPELAFVGKTEAQVMKELGVCACRGVKFSSLPKSKIINHDEGYAKIIIDPYTREVKGVHVYSPYASEIILQASLYIRHRYKVEDILDVIQVFPTVSEIVKLSAQAFIRRVDKMPCCVE